MEPSKLAAIYENSVARNFFTNDWDKALAVYAFFSENLKLSKVLMEIAQKDLGHAQALANEAGIDCPILDSITQAANNIGDDEIKERLRSII